MKCRVCGAPLRSINTDLPLKVSDHTIVIVKKLPVLQCDGCIEYLIEDSVMARGRRAPGPDRSVEGAGGRSVRCLTDSCIHRTLALSRASARRMTAATHRSGRPDVAELHPGLAGQDEPGSSTPIRPPQRRGDAKNQQRRDLTTMPTCEPLP